jgi:1-acyl-sn-glycerol-3-phosphate acyltransferase
LIIDYLPKGHFKWMRCLAASDLETQHGKLGRLIMRVGRGIAVDRYGNPVRGLIKAKKEVEQGNICFVFPEGTRTHTGKLAELKDGASYLAIKAGVPLVPVYIAGAYQIWPRTQKHPHPLNGLHRRKIRIYVGEPMYGKDYDNDAHKMTEVLSEWMHRQEDMHWDPETNFD